MNFSERIRYWKGEIATMLNDTEKARQEYEEIQINFKLDTDKLLERFFEKQRALMETLGIMINQISKFAPTTANGLEQELKNIQKLENELNLMLNDTGLLKRIKNQKNIEKKTESLKRRLTSLEAVCLGVASGIEETILKVEKTYFEDN